MISLDAAESIVASSMNIKKDAVRSTVFSPLASHDLISISQRVHSVFIIVYDVEEVSQVDE
jgi:hypothetical protein